MQFTVTGDIRGLSRQLKAFQRDQVPFATAKALTAIASKVREAETKAAETTFDRPTPFTKAAFGVTSATKKTLTATVFVKDRQARYLIPYLDPNGGRQVPGKRAILTPIDIALNQYGNIPKGKLAQLRGRPGIFIGPIKTKSGQTINGVWQRPTPVTTGRKIRGHLANNTGRVKLLVRFTSPVMITGHNLQYQTRAAKIIKASIESEFSKAMAQAMATRR